MKFQCEKCGSCCRQLKLTLETWGASGDKIVRDIASCFPYNPLPDGSCPMLKDNECSVYYGRPVMCNIDASFRVLGGKKKNLKIYHDACKVYCLFYKGLNNPWDKVNNEND